VADADAAIFGTLPRVAERAIAGAAELDQQLQTAGTPFIVRGLVADWPLVQAGLKSGRTARDYLASLAADRPFVASVGAKGSDGRFFYNEAMSMNFRMATAKLPDIFAQMDAGEQSGEAQPIYLASIDVKGFFNGLHEANHVDLGARSPLESIWIGTPTRIAAHNDFPQNLACVAVGRRRFTLFPPDQFRNLYLGPVDHTPAGRAISMVDFHAPDFARFPRFSDALQHAQVAELAPGDALFIPSMWWHHVEGLDPFNVLVNYWWRDTPRWLGQPQDALNHAMMAIRDLPAAEKQHWRELFDWYVFDNGKDVVDHISPQARSILAPLTQEGAGRIRSFLLRALSR